jgi:SnoaL-like domain
MAVDRQQVAAWLDAYSQAWRSYDPRAIGELFSSDAQYAYSPWDEPVRGREAIVASWLEDKDEPGTYDGRYEPLAVDGDLAVATGRSRYLDADGAVEREYSNMFVLRFDAEGRCREFREWYMLRRDDAG